MSMIPGLQGIGPYNQKIGRQRERSQHIHDKFNRMMQEFKVE